jgi:hypothetical protein
VGVSAHPEALSRLLRWYPAPWRDRYGDEMVALMSDDLEGRSPSFGYRLRVMGAGVRERARRAGVAGADASAAERTRSGSLIVLVAWSAFVLAGAGFAKESEHFVNALHPNARVLPQMAYDVVVALGCLGTGLVLAGALIAVPSFGRYLRNGGWSSMRRRLVVALSLTVATTVAIVPLAAWAHRLNVVQRNGGLAVYSGAFLGWAVLVVATLVAWTVVAVAAARRTQLSARVLKVESSFAVLLAGVMAALTVATGVWWWAMATRAPWYMHWSPLGSNAYMFFAQLAVTVAVMVAGVALSGYGAYRAVVSRRGLDSESGSVEVTPA